MTVAFDRLVVSGHVKFDRLVDTTTAPFIESITGAQDGEPLTFTGTGFDASGNTVYAGVPDDDENTPLEIAVDTEGTTEIVTDDLDAAGFWLTRPTTFFVRNSLGVASNVVSVTIAPAATERAFAVAQEFLGDSSTRIESDPPLSLGDEIRVRNASGASLADLNMTGQGAFDFDDGGTSFEAAIFDGEILGDWAAQTLDDPVSAATIPDVEGDTEAVATAAIEAVGLVASVVARVPSTLFDAGEVITQFPAAGEELTLGGTVELTVSLGDDVVLVPDFSQLSSAEAQANRTAVGLVGTVYRVIDGNNTGAVIGQSIAPGTLVAVGSAVDLAVSSNLMPDLVGEHVNTAGSIISAANLTLDSTTEQYSASVDVGEVISQSPAADSVVDALDAVTLTVSLGAEPVALGGGFDFGFGFGFHFGASIGSEGGGGETDTIWGDIWQDIWGDIWAEPS